MLKKKPLHRAAGNENKDVYCENISEVPQKI
jgi:hypothetical protein